MKHHDEASHTSPPADGTVGWYQDPSDPREHRYWDGARWSRVAGADDAPPGTSSTAPAAERRDPVTAAELWWYPAAARLVWSEEALLLHGYGGAQPDVTLELMLSHVVESDRDAVSTCFAEAGREGTPLRSQYRMHRTDGAGREVVLVAALEGDGGASSYHGFLVDVGPQLVRAANLAVAAARRGNGAVQRAVGVLGAVLGVDPETALAVLRRASSDSNVKLRDLAQQVVDAVPALAEEPGRAPARVRRLLQRPDRPAPRMAPAPRLAPAPRVEPPPVD